MNPPGIITVDNATLEIAAGVTRIKDAGVTAAKLAQNYVQGVAAGYKLARGTDVENPGVEARTLSTGLASVVAVLITVEDAGGIKAAAEIQSVAGADVTYKIVNTNANTYVTDSRTVHWVAVGT